MTLAPLAAADSFTVTQGLAYTLVTGNLGADNGAGIDYDPMAACSALSQASGSIRSAMATAILARSFPEAPLGS